ncbi:MAG: sigma-54 interaction domain-containing protein [Aeromonas sobria]
MIALLESVAAQSDPLLAEVAAHTQCQRLSLSALTPLWQATHTPQPDLLRAATLLLITAVRCNESQMAQLLTAIRQLRKRYPALPLLLLTAPELGAWTAQALAAGVNDYLLYPFHASQLQQQIQRLQQPRAGSDWMVMQAASMRHLLTLAERVAHSHASVLITGESGTGKEVLVQYLHSHSPRAHKPLIAINCAAIPETMLEAMLFGYVKGAYTGAQQSQAGKFELAQGGTLFLDEIAEMSPALQAKLLRVLQERSVERLGSNKTIALDIRIIAATNQDLTAAVESGQFRADLLYRLEVLPLHLPPLRQRREDILPLTRHFIAKHVEMLPADTITLSPVLQLALQQAPWPGNIRELENRVQRALVLCRGTELQLSDFGLDHCHQAVTDPGPDLDEPEGVTSPEPLEVPHNLKQSRKRGEFQLILTTLMRFQGHRGHTAAALGVTTRALRYKLAQMKEQGWGIDEHLAHAV